MMLAGVYNITCEQGATFLRVMLLEYPDPNDSTQTTYLPWDFTDYTARMQVRRTYDSTSPMIELTTENGGITLNDGEQGEIRIIMTDAQTASLSSNGVYDLEIVSPEGNVSRVIQGTFTLSLEVTR